MKKIKLLVLLPLLFTTLSLSALVAIANPQKAEASSYFNSMCKYYTRNTAYSAPITFRAVYKNWSSRRAIVGIGKYNATTYAYVNPYSYGSLTYTMANNVWIYTYVNGVRTNTWRTAAQLPSC